MKKLILIYSLLLSVFGGDIFGQISVSRTPTLNFTNCNTQTLTYVVGVSSGTYGTITMTEDFTAGGCNDCLTIQAVGSPIPGLIVNNATKQVIYTLPPGNYSGTQTYTFQITITGNNIGTNAGKYRNCRVCSDGPTVTCTTPTTISITPTSRECITLKNENRWGSDISGNCVIQTGLNCYQYPVRIFGNACDGMNLSGNAWFDFSVPAGASITGVTAVGNHALGTIGGIGTNNIRFQSIPNGGEYKIINSYYVNVNVQYPCITFPANNLTTVTATLSNSIISFPPSIGLTEMPSCPPGIVRLGGETITGTSITHTLDELETDASLSITRVYQQGHDAAGCSNRYDIAFCNRGNTILENIVVTTDPLPANIQLTQVCGSNISGYKLNNGAWQNGSPTSGNIAQVTGVRWNLPDVYPGQQCDTLSPRRCASLLHLCYSIRPGVSVGTNIEACIGATFDQRVACRAQGCTQPVPGPPFSLPLPACHDFDVTSDETAPAIGKTVSPVSGYPGQLLNFTITVGNCGSGNLITQIRDNFPASLTNVTITGYDRSHNGSPWQSGPGTWLTSPAIISGNNVSVDIDIPGICDTRPSNTQCCVQVCNFFRVHLQATIASCEQAGRKTNTVSLFPQTSHTASTRFTVYNYNRLVMTKEAKGDISSNYSFNPTDVSPGGTINYKIKISNLDPRRWYDPVLVDLLPSIAGRTFCGNPVPATGFDVRLSRAILAADIDYSNAPNIISGNTNIKYAPWSSTLTDAAFCSGGTTVNLPYSIANNRAVRFDFDGFLDCDEYITINIPAEVMSNSATGIANNIIFKTEKTTPGGQYGVTVSDNVDAQIVDWTPGCCDPSITWASFSQVGDRIDGGDHELIRGDFILQSPSPIPIQKVRASIIDFSYDQSLQDCYKCKNNFKYLGTYPWWGASEIGNSNPPGNNLQNISNPPYPYMHNRERIWEGTPTDLSAGVNYPIYFQIPKPLDIPCCQGCITMCVKFEFTDVNCNTCEDVVCFSVKQSPPTPETVPTPCDNPNGSNRVNGVGGIISPESINEEFEPVPNGGPKNFNK